uniref:Enteropeptidase-1 n=1 Tax=Oryzias latipes TaxID=8090 RepID=A4UWM5_ORYLA|nr:enteropeptidase-1 [Oryzias latipes]BAF57203.1 enteropeptidase-1 [Oryzias latipes]
MKRRLTNLEVLLTVTTSLFAVCCVCLIVVSCIGLKPEGAAQPVQLTGQMVITAGAAFSEELRNSSSHFFKSLAFDVQQLVSDAFGASELRLLYRSFRVLYFRPGSIAVTFDLEFNQQIDLNEVKQQLGEGLQQIEDGALVIDVDSIQITVKPSSTTPQPTPTTGHITTETMPITGHTTPAATPTAASCPPDHSLCWDRSTCVLTDVLCDGVSDCPDASDENSSRCATTCDGQFVLGGPNGTFRSSETETYRNNSNCRWIIRMDGGLSVQVNFHHFETEEYSDVLKLYEGVGPHKQLAAELSGPSPPGTVLLLNNQVTVEFTSDGVNDLSGFRASYAAVNTSSLSNQEKLSCSFDQGFCFWRQLQDSFDTWIRTNVPTFPPLTGPNFDHTFGNSSGFYIVTSLSPGQWLKSFVINSLPLAPSSHPTCLSFWYHMFGEDVYRLRVLLRPSQPELTEVVLFHKEGNFGDNWNYAQITLNLSTESTVVFEAQKEGGNQNDIALDDISLRSEGCGPAPPEPTNVPLPTTAAPIPPDCGGPFDLWEPNSTFTSPNYPQSYGDRAECLWTLHAEKGQNIQLHFLDFDVEATYDVVEVRDGAGLNSTLLAVLSGSDGPTHDLYSTDNQMTVWFYTDSGGFGRGFRANFTSGVNLGSQAPCANGQFQCQTGDCIHGDRQCDGVADCPDGYDEADCVALQVNGSHRLHFRLLHSLLTVCADTWDSELSDFTCQYLGYRSGEESLQPVLPQDAAFAVVTVSSNGTLETQVRETCSSGEVISLNCSNQPCGQRQVYNSKENNGVPRVVGGVNAEKGAWPWMVSLHWRGRHGCGASLIGRDWLLTAAHCVYGKNTHLQYWSAVLGLHAQSSMNSQEVQIRQVDRIIINKNYNRRTKEADIAMMHLQQPVNFTEWVLPVCLASEDQHFPAGRRCFIAGWGRDAEGGSLPDILQEAEVPLVDQDECQRLLPEYTFTSSMLCAGYPEGGVDSCQGDSGGPLMCLEDARWTLIGVTSFGVGCGRPERPGAYARVSAFTSWIAETRRSSFSDLD